MDKETVDEIRAGRKKWEENTVEPALKRFKADKDRVKYYTPLETENFNFMEKVGFPGEYPFTAGPYAFNPLGAGRKGGGFIQSAEGMRRAGRYSGYGCAEDTRDYYKKMQEIGSKAGPNFAFDLPTQCGYDSDNPMVRGDVGKVGVAVDTLHDFELVYEAFQGYLDLDKIASNFTVNATANIIVAMYIALAEKRGIPISKLKGTPQNDILKEFVARGTYIFPPRPSMNRMFRDSITFFTKYLPGINITSIAGYHMREAGATREQDLGFTMAFVQAYIQEGIDAGLDVDEFVPKFSFNAFGGSMELLKEVAFMRAVRRMYARIVKEKFKAKNPRSLILRMPIWAHMGAVSATAQRPLNNLVRATLGAAAGALSGGPPNAFPYFDEPLGLGWSLEAIQLGEDAGRIVQYEAKLTEVCDPLAGSYYVEYLTDEFENKALEIMKIIDDMGGAINAIENGYISREIANEAYEKQRKIESGEELIVGVNCFTGEEEIEVNVQRSVLHPYDPEKREEAEERQIKNLAEVKRIRDHRNVSRLLGELKEKAKREDENLIPHFVECVKAYATIQEMCDVLRDVFGEYEKEVVL